jgi:hypothetical protein
MSEILFLCFTYRVVGQEDEKFFRSETIQRVMKIDPGLHTFPGLKVRARRTKFDRNHRSRLKKLFKQESLAVWS